MKKVVNIVSALLLSGCVTLYPSPKAPGSPTVSIDTSETSFMTVYENGEDCSGLRKIPNEYNPFLEGSKPLPLKPNEKVAFRLHYSYGTFGNEYKYCALMLSFEAKEDYDYHLSYVKNDEECAAQLTKKQQNSSASSYEIDNTLKLRSERMAMTSEDAFCHSVVE